MKKDNKINTLKPNQKSMDVTIIMTYYSVTKIGHPQITSHNL